ncbi:MAG TPA: hypothetical protein VF008_09765 [Niastella sp.]
MLTQNKIDKFYLDVNSLDIKKKVSVITKETAFPQSNVSEWLNKVKRPSEAFIDKFYEKFGYMIKASTKVLQNNVVSEPDLIYETNDQINFIELKTASGKTLKVMPEGPGEVALLNAFLEERDRAIEDLMTDKTKLQNTIDSNLTAMMQLLSALSRHDRAFHETMLKSLARLEKRQENDLVAEARSFEAVKQLEEQTGGK